MSPYLTAICMVQQVTSITYVMIQHVTGVTYVMIQYVTGITYAMLELQEDALSYKKRLWFLITSLQPFFICSIHVTFPSMISPRICVINTCSMFVPFKIMFPNCLCCVLFANIKRCFGHIKR